MDRLSLLLVALAASSCTTPNAVLITVRSDAKVVQYDLYVRQDDTSQIVFHSGFNPVQTPSEKPRDLTTDGLKIALKIAKPGSYTIQMIGVTSDPENGRPAPNTEWQFWADRVQVDGTVEVSAKLLTVAIGDDVDGDLWPETNAFLMHNPGAPAIYAKHHELLDCDDDPASMPVDKDGNPIKYMASDINPFAVEICGNGFDEDCDGKDAPCIDHDKDGESSITDCDDNDPKRHHATAADPFPDPPNCCGYNLGKKGTPDEFKDFTGDPVLCPMKRCGDGIDESCQGKDTTCIVDADCDGDPAPPIGNDCDDNDPTVHVGALEPCGSTKDLNCDGVVNGGCVPCDLDGDGYQRNDPTNGCPDNKDKNPGKVDCNDYDSAVFPGSTKDAGGTEGGKTAIGRLNASLAQFCRRIYEPKGMTGTAKISANGWLVGDMDCNGTAYEGCPTAACDADGDGFPRDDAANGCVDPDGKYDCDDTDPTIYPGAPVSCGSGPAENCTDQKQPCDQDADHDGWNAGADCDDGDPAVHPWAVELCDGKDNDCDKMVDEGNPDVSGKPLVDNGAVTACTDNNVGECGKTKGTCVCAIALPMSKINSADRVICPTEDSGSAKPPHCFGAGQPHPQSCNHDDPKDDDCNGSLDDVAGVNLAVKGQPCGMMGPGAVSICRPGVVIGCDTQQTNCFAAYGRVAMSQAWYICSTEAVCPHAEQCNGFDDDCNGSPLNATMSPDPDENDIDKDGYLACTGCAGLTLASGVKGCDDCDDTRNDTFPGAPEKCDSRNNSCDQNWSLSPTGSDGKDECTGASPNCCSDENTCRNTSNGDVNHCGGCAAANICTLLRNNQCKNGMCVCGQSAAAATCGVSATGNGTDSFWCNAGNNGGTCESCTTNSHCGPNCVDCGAMSVCKTDKTGCTGCNIDGDCQGRTPGTYCNTGACQACQVNNHCGNPSCTDCTAGATNKVCVNNGGNYQCGCTMNNQCNSGEYCNSLTCAACTVDAHCGSSCTNCGAQSSNKVCVNNSGTYQCGCTGNGNCAATEYCNGQGCATCNTFDHCSTGSSCTNCSANNNGHLCKNPGMAQPCGCTGDSDCATGYFCNGGTCSQCTVAAHCGYPTSCNSCSGNGNGGACVGSSSYTCGCNNGGDCPSTQYCTGSKTCAACNVFDHCSNGTSCMTCSGNSNGSKCTNPGNAQPCGCTTVGAGGDCGTTQYCNSGTCSSCNIDALCSNGTTCVTCSGNTPKCRAPGTASPCGCTGDGDCAANQYCNGSHVCTACGLGADCTGHCASQCGSTNYCNGTTCVTCNVQGECSNGTSCVDCSANTKGFQCKNPGMAQPCGCNGPSDCPGTSFCSGGGTCSACNTQTQCSNGTSCMTCVANSNGTQCKNPGMAQPCGCTVAATDCTVNETCSSGSCACGGGSGCTAGSCCNGSSCGTQDTATNCGTTCQDCTSAANGQKCLGAAKHCGCTSFATDCDATLSDACNGATGLCTCKGGPACTPGVTTCKASGCG